MIRTVRFFVGGEGSSQWARVEVEDDREEVRDAIIAMVKAAARVALKCQQDEGSVPLE